MWLQWILLLRHFKDCINPLLPREICKANQLEGKQQLDSQLPHGSPRCSSVKSSTVLTSNILKQTFLLHTIAKLHRVWISYQMGLILQCYYLIHTIFFLCFIFCRCTSPINTYFTKNREVRSFCSHKDALYPFSCPLLKLKQLEQSFTMHL